MPRVAYAFGQCAFQINAVGYVQSLLSKFNIQSLSCRKHELKLHIWNTFVSETMCRGH